MKLESYVQLQGDVKDSPASLLLYGLAGLRLPGPRPGAARDARPRLGKKPRESPPVLRGVAPVGARDRAELPLEAIAGLAGEGLWLIGALRRVLFRDDPGAEDSAPGEPARSDPAPGAGRRKSGETTRLTLASVSDPAHHAPPLILLVVSIHASLFSHGTHYSFCAVH